MSSSNFENRVQDTHVCCAWGLSTLSILLLSFSLLSSFPVFIFETRSHVLIHARAHRNAYKFTSPSASQAEWYVVSLFCSVLFTGSAVKRNCCRDMCASERACVCACKAQCAFEWFKKCTVFFVVAMKTEHETISREHRTCTQKASWKGTNWIWIGTHAIFFSLLRRSDKTHTHTQMFKLTKGWVNEEWREKNAFVMLLEFKNHRLKCCVKVRWRWNFVDIFFRVYKMNENAFVSVDTLVFSFSFKLDSITDGWS